MKKFIYSLMVVAAAGAFAPIASAATLTCPEGQMVGSVMTDPGVVGTPAVTHIVHHDAVTHTETVVDVAAYDETIVITPAYDETVIDTPAFDSFSFTGGNSNDYDITLATHVATNHGSYDKQGSHYVYVGAGHGDYDVTFHSVTHNHGDYGVTHHTAVTHVVHHPAVTSVIHHSAVTHETTVVDHGAYNETVIDVPAVMTVPPTFVDQCVTDPGYVPPTSPAQPPAGGGGSLIWCSSPLAPGWNTSFPDGGCGGPVAFSFGQTLGGFLCVFKWGCVLPK